MKEGTKRLLKKMSIALLGVLLIVIMCFSLVACGTEGAQGEKGDQGIQGEQGLPGKDGDDGKDYETPKPNPTGTNGTPQKSKFYTDYASLTEVQEEAAKVAEEIATESWVLLKNEQNNLPITKADPKVSVFGKNSSSVSGALRTAGSGFAINEDLRTFYSNATASGAAQAVSKGSSFNSTGETPQSMYTQPIKDSYATYNDSAIVVFSRSAGEGSDTSKASFATTAGQATSVAAYPTRQEIEKSMDPNDAYEWTPVGGKGREHNPFEHFLQLDSNEYALLDMLQADENFDNIIVIISTDRVMELDFLKQDKYSKIKSAFWNPGGSNINTVLPAILKGEINPSGRTVDTFQADLKADPTWENYAHNFVGNETGAVPTNAYKGNQYTKENGTLWEDYWGKTFYEVSYEEGIYLGYKYYETRGFTEYEETNSYNWYNDHVVYPMGYGLSYTKFNWELVDQSPKQNATVGMYDEIKLQVKVTNAGDVAGKDVVQIYYEAPYYDGGIEKSKVEFVDFAKTGMLAAGASETLTLTLDVRDMASYDFNDANGNGTKGYELDEGNYSIYVSKNANSWIHNSTPTLKYVVPEGGFYYDTDENSGDEIKNRFDYVSDDMKDRTLSRSDWEGTWPTRPLWFDVTNDTTIDFLWAAEYRATHNGANWTAADNSVTPKYFKKAKAELVKDEAFMNNMLMPLEDESKLLMHDPSSTNDGRLATWYDEANPRYGGGKAPWYRETKPTVRAEAERYTEGNLAPIQLGDLVGKHFDDPLWDKYMDQFSVRQLTAHIITGFDITEELGLGIPGISHGDGPGGIGLTNYTDLQFSRMAKSGVSFGNQIALSATWSKELAYKYGEINGEFGLWSKIMGWYAPGCNIHRSPFSGRNGQYYSEDGVYTGKFMAAVVRGCNSKGIITFMKHYALNDQETNRDTNAISTWADEQVMREIYLKGFEIAIKEGGALGMMSSFNRIGYDWVGASYEALTEIPRDEWGWDGIYVTDATGTPQAYDYMSANMMIRTGNDLSLNFRYRYDESKENHSNPNGFAESVVQLTITEAAQTATHLWAMRDCAKRSLFVMAQTACMLNGHTIFSMSDGAGYNAGGTYTSLSAGRGQHSPCFAGTFTGSLDQSTVPTLATKAAGERVDVSVADSDLTGFKYILFANSLPKGLTLDSKTGRITGKIAADAASGTYQFTIAPVDENIVKGEEWTAKTINDFIIVVS